MNAARYGAESDAKSWLDLCRVTGLGRETVKAAIVAGELPGYLIGSRYIVPAEAFDAFCRGEWRPAPRPILAQQPNPVFLHSRKERSA